MFERGVCNMLIGVKFVSYDSNEGETNSGHEEQSSDCVPFLRSG